MALANTTHDAFDTFYAALEEALAVNGTAICRYDGTDVEHLGKGEDIGLCVITHNALGTLDEGFYSSSAAAALDMAGASVVPPARRRTRG